MLPNESSPGAGSPPARKGSVLRYLAPLVLLVVVISGIAWVAQYLPRWKQPKTVTPEQQVGGKKLLEFPRVIARWSNKPPEPEGKEGVRPKDYEPGQKGHYDFPFKNISGEEVEIVFYSSSCDCASVQACVLEADELERVHKASLDKPADPLPYGAEPVWKEVTKQPDWVKLTKEAQAEKSLLVKPNQGGVVRTRWVAKSAGQEMKVMPVVWHLRKGDGQVSGQALGVPVLVALPVHFYPPRRNIGGLTLGAKATEEFHAWSSTREPLDLKLSADALFDITMTPLSQKECDELETTLKNDANLSTGKTPPHVRSAQRVVVTVHESRNGKQLDLGSFFRKLDVTLDNVPLRDVPGPEIVGRVHGGVVIGGADDQGRVRFKSFSAREGAIKSVELSADPKWQLETFKQDPAWIKVTLTRAAKQEDPQRTVWRLEIEVPQNTPAAHSFEEPNAVILRIVGPPERFVRIPLEGHLSDH